MNHLKYSIHEKHHSMLAGVGNLKDETVCHSWQFTIYFDVFVCSIYLLFYRKFIDQPEI